MSTIDSNSKNDVSQKPSDKLTYEDFVDRLITEATGDTELTDEIRSQMKEDMLRQLNEMINAKTIAEMTDEQVEAFNQLLGTKPEPEKVQEFIAGVIPDRVEFVSEVMLEYRRQYLGLV